MRLLRFWNSLSPFTRHIIASVVTVMFSGGSTAIGSIQIDPEHFSLAHLQRVGLMFAIGAAMDFFNWCRDKPWEKFGRD